MKHNIPFNSKTHRNEYDREWRIKNPESFRKSQRKYNASEHGIIQRRKRHLEKEFNITIEQYDALVLKQENRCAICGIHQSELAKSFDVDHNHKTGKVRGLLCNKCNQGIGLLQDSLEIIHKVESYLEER